jgi:hypothetical protein
MLNEIENVLIDRIKTALPGYLVRSYPEKPASFTMIHPKGAVLVRFAGGSYGQVNDIGAVVQERKTEWEITAVARNLVAHGGMYAMLDALRIALTGFKVPGCYKAAPMREGFVNEDEGLWQYVFIVSIKTMNVEMVDIDALPLLKRLTLEDNFEETTEIP